MSNAVPTKGGYLLTPSPIRAALALNVRVTDTRNNWRVPANRGTGLASAHSPILDATVYHQRAYERACVRKIEHIMQRDGVSRAQATPQAVALVGTQCRNGRPRWVGVRHYITGKVL